MLRGSLVILVLISISLGYLNAFAEITEPKINVLALSKVSAVQKLSNWFSVEPSIEHRIVPTRVYGDDTREDIERYMRIYFPRSEDDLLAYNFYYLAQTDMTFLNPAQELWIYGALTDHQKGGVNTRSVMSTHSWFNIPWAESMVSEAFPNDADAVIANEADQEGAPGPLIIRDDEKLPAIISPYKDPLEGTFRNLGGLNTIPKQGSVILSYTKNGAGLGYPIPGQIAHIFYWRWNKSITFTFRDQPMHFFWNSLGSSTSNHFALDITVNVIWFSTGRKLPDDPLKVHQFRRDSFEFNIEKSLLISLLDFAEAFGANPAKLYQQLDEIQLARQETAELYLERQFDDAYESMKSLKGELKILEKKASKLKGSALTWVYIVEWLSITATSLLAGFIIWTLMIKRTLYREVRSTRTAL